MTDQYRDWILAEGFDKPARKRGSALPKRKKPTLADKVAALLLLMPPRADGTPLIPDDVRAKGRAAILAYPLHWDHIIARGLCGTDTFDNYRPLAVEDHKPKTKADKKRMAHNNRLQLSREQQQYVAQRLLELAGDRQKQLQEQFRKFREQLLAPNPDDHVTRVSKKVVRPMMGSKASGWKQKLRGGKWEKRT